MFEHIQDFISDPFNESMDLWGWIAFIVVVGSIAYLWLQVLKTVKDSLK